MNKRGQFFLLAALVLVGLLIGLRTLYNSVDSREENFNLSDLSSEVKFESNQVIDNGVFIGETKDAIKNKVKDLFKIYAKLNPRNQLLILIGDSSGVKAVYTTPPEREINFTGFSRTLDSEESLYENPSGTGEIVVSTGGGKFSNKFESIKVKTESLSLDSTSSPKSITVLIDNKIERIFNLNQGQNFYIVISL